MPKPSGAAEAFTGAGRIRKRGCSSSSSSSSVLQNCRLKRAVLVARRAIASTPAPAWKTEAGSQSSASETVTAVTRCQQQRQAAGSVCGSKEKNQGPVSARKLASALWELHGAPPAPTAQGRRRKEESGFENLGREYGGKLPSCLSDPSHSPCSEVADRSGSGLHRRRGSPLASQKSRLSGYNNNSSSLDSFSNGSSMEIEKRSRSIAPVSSSFGKTQQNCLKDLKNGLYASKELLKTLNRFLQMEVPHHSSLASSSSIAPIISALHDELDRARLRANYLSETSSEYINTATHLTQKFTEEKSMYKAKLQERIRDAVQSTTEELAIERKLRRRADRLNERLMMELTETKSRLARAVEESEDERRRREVIEQVCDELVKGIGEDRAEMEKMKEESEKVREELEKEREMLQLADVWREERVQMKLSEAKYEMEEKNAAVDQLRHELETYLLKKRSKGELKGYGNVKVDDVVVTAAEERGERRDRDVRPLRCNKKSAGEVEENGNAENAGSGSVVDDGELDSEDSDLHSIELSVDNINRSYRWNFTAATTADDEDDQQQQEAELSPLSASRLAYQQEQLEAPGCSRWSFDGRGLEGFDFRGLDLDMISRQEDDYSYNNNKFDDQDAERYYTSVKVLRDQMLSSCKMALATTSSPTKTWAQQPRQSLDCKPENTGGVAGDGERELQQLHD